MDNRDELVTPYHKADKTIEKGYRMLGEANRNFSTIKDGEIKQVKLEQQIGKVKHDTPLIASTGVMFGVIIGIILAVLLALWTYKIIL